MTQAWWRWAAGLLAGVAAVLPGPARAEAYPWVPLHDDVRMVADPRLDLELRLRLIADARETIDLVLYEQGDDRAVGMPVLSALRQAADRGVRVRVITQWFFQYLYHPLNQSPSYTTNPPAAVPIEYVVFGAPESVLRHGWAPSDGIHGKLMIVDRRVGLTTGRGHAEMNLRWLDDSFLFKGAMVDQSVSAFESLWQDARRLGEVYRPTFPRAHPTWQQSNAIPLQAAYRLPAEQQPQLLGLLAWVQRPQDVVTVAASPGGPRGRMLHFDFVRQMDTLMRHGGAPRDWDGRLAVLKDPVVDAFVERVDRAGPGAEVRFVSMYAMLHPRVKDAAIRASRRGAKVQVLTNDDFTAPPVSTLAYLASLQDLAQVATRGPAVYLFQRSSQPRWDFLHLKLVVVDDTVIFGSHNLNVASSAANDEIAYEVDDPAVAAEARAYFDHCVRDNSRRMHPGRAEAMRPFGAPVRLLLDPVLGFW